MLVLEARQRNLLISPIKLGINCVDYNVSLEFVTHRVISLFQILDLFAEYLTVIAVLFIFVMAALDELH